MRSSISRLSLRATASLRFGSAAANVATSSHAASSSFFGATSSSSANGSGAIALTNASSVAAALLSSQQYQQLMKQATVVMPTDKMLWGSNITEDLLSDSYTTADLRNIILGEGKGRSQPLPLVVYAHTVGRLLTEGLCEEAIEIALARPSAQDRGVVIELGAAMCPIWSESWRFVRQLSAIENGSVLRATLHVAHVSNQGDIIDEALAFVLQTCRRKKQLAGEVLRPFCQLLRPAQWSEGNELHDLAQQSGVYYDIQQIDALMWLMVKARQHKRVLALWNWAKNTTAGNSKAVISAVIVALTSERQRLTAILQLMQHLARSDEDPTGEAQIATINLMASLRRPNADYAAQLVSFWMPINGYTSMRLNLSVASAYIKLSGSPNATDAAAAAAKAVDSMLKIANDVEQARELRPKAVVKLLPALTKSKDGKEVLEKLVETIVDGCVDRVHLEGMGVAMAFAALSGSEASLVRILYGLRSIITNEVFDLGAATAPSSTDAEMEGGSDAATASAGSSSSSSSESFFGANDDGFGGSSSSENTSSSSSAVRGADSSDSQLAFEFVCREMFAAMRANDFKTGKTMANAIAAELSSPSERYTEDPMHVAALPTVVPTDTAEWFTLINSSETDDASVILDELGRDE